MRDFMYYAPTKVVFGRNTEDRVGALVREQGAKKVLIHYGGGSVIRSGLMDRVKAALEAEAIPYVMLGGVVPNPRVSKVREGIELCKNEGVDFILAVGGGSVIDSAKAMGYGLYNGGEVWDFYEGLRKAEGCTPIGVVLTLSATGSEMSNSSVITNEEECKKRGYSSDFGRPRFAVMNPELTMTLPDYQTACGCSDIMMHTMERYFTNSGSLDITDRFSEQLLKTVMENAGILVREPDNYEARAEIMWAGSLSHNDLLTCGNDKGDWQCHKMEHEIGAMFDVAHGAGLAAVWGSWARYVYRDCVDKFRKFAVNVMDIPEQGSDDEIILRGIEALEDFFRSIKMPTNLKELGIEPTEEQLGALAAGWSVTVGGKAGTAKVLVESDVYNILKNALQG